MAPPSAREFYCDSSLKSYCCDILYSYDSIDKSARLTVCGGRGGGERENVKEREEKRRKKMERRREKKEKE